MGRLELESTLLPWRIIRGEGRRETRHPPLHEVNCVVFRKMKNVKNHNPEIGWRLGVLRAKDKGGKTAVAFCDGGWDLTSKIGANKMRKSANR